LIILRFSLFSSTCSPLGPPLFLMRKWSGQHSWLIVFVDIVPIQSIILDHFIFTKLLAHGPTDVLIVVLVISPLLRIDCFIIMRNFRVRLEFNARVNLNLLFSCSLSLALNWIFISGTVDWWGRQISSCYTVYLTPELIQFVVSIHRSNRKKFFLSRSRISVTGVTSIHVCDFVIGLGSDLRPRDIFTRLKRLPILNVSWEDVTYFLYLSVLRILSRDSPGLKLISWYLARLNWKRWTRQLHHFSRCSESL
jgi:hypothetical protein